MATTLNGATLADPSSCKCTVGYIEARERDLTGAEHVDRTTYKRTWQVGWNVLTSALWSTLNTEAVKNQSMVWLAPDGSTGTVTVAAYTWDDVAIRGGPGYRVSLTLSEV